MIKFKDTILEDYFIDPVTAIITNSKGEVQKTYIIKGRPYFKKHSIHQLMVHTHVGWKKGLVIHHIDGNKMNNSLSNLTYLTSSEHAKIHLKSESHPMKGRTLSEETKRKMSESRKGEKKKMACLESNILKKLNKRSVKQRKE